MQGQSGCHRPKSVVAGDGNHGKCQPWNHKGITPALRPAWHAAPFGRALAGSDPKSHLHLHLHLRAPPAPPPAHKTTWPTSPARVSRPIRLQGSSTTSTTTTTTTTSHRPFPSLYLPSRPAVCHLRPIAPSVYRRELELQQSFPPTINTKPINPAHTTFPINTCLSTPCLPTGLG